MSPGPGAWLGAPAWAAWTLVAAGPALAQADAPADAAGSPCDASAWAAVVAAHLAARSEAEAPDVYKLLHQGVFGSEHAVPSRAEAARWLEDEIASLGPLGSAVGALEPIAPDSAHVRVHLRPFLAAGGDPDRLLDAFVATANEGAAARRAAPARGVETFRCAAAAASDVLAGDEARDAWEGYVAARVGEGLPAVHHSPRFTAAQAPAYRVVARGRLAAIAPPGGAAPDLPRAP